MSPCSADMLCLPPVLCHLGTQPTTVVGSCRSLLMSLFDWMLPPMVRVATKMIRAPVPMQNLNLVQSCMRLLETMLAEFKTNAAAVTELSDNMQAVSAGCLAG